MNGKQHNRYQAVCWKLLDDICISMLYVDLKMVWRVSNHMGLFFLTVGVVIAGRALTVI